MSCEKDDYLTEKKNTYPDRTSIDHIKDKDVKPIDTGGQGDDLPDED